MADAPGERSARRWPWLAVLVAVAVAIAVALFWPAPTKPARDGSGSVDVAAPAAPGTENFAAAEPIDRDELPPAIKRYLDATVYPPSTGQLSASQVDLIHPNQRYEDFRRIPETFSMNADEIFSVQLTSEQYFYTGDETVHLDLSLKHGELEVDPISISASAIREGRAGPEGAKTPLRFHREGRGHVAELDTAPFEDHHGPIVVNARIEYQPSVFYDEVLRFYFTPIGKIPARFNGQLEDAVVNGSLRVKIGIDVEQSGYYRIDANLYDRNGAPVAFASYKGNLDRGDRFVPIEFFGRILRDRGASGPYSVGEIRGYRFLDGQYPDRERLRDLAGRFHTSAYDLAVFSESEYTSPHKAQMVKLLLEDVANGISIDQPSFPAANTTAGAATPGAAGRGP